MLSLIADENFRGGIVRGLRRRDPAIDIVTVQEAGIDGMLDPELLAWAAEHHRIILSHDQRTLPGFAYQRIDAGSHVEGVFVMDDLYPIGLAIAEVLLVNECSEQREWANHVVYLPL